MIHVKAGYAGNIGSGIPIDSSVTAYASTGDYLYVGSSDATACKVIFEGSGAMYLAASCDVATTDGSITEVICNSAAGSLYLKGSYWVTAAVPSEVTKLTVNRGSVYVQPNTWVQEYQIHPAFGQGSLSTVKIGMDCYDTAATAGITALNMSDGLLHCDTGIETMDIADGTI